MYEAPGGGWHTLQCGYRTVEHRETCVCGLPARVLAEVAAKRAILADHAGVPLGDRAFCRRCGEPPQWGFEAGTVDYPCPTLLALAQPYGDHIDFNPAWATH